MSDLACYIEHGAILPLVSLSSAIVMLWFIYQYFQAMRSEHNKRLKISGFILFFTQFIFCIANAASYPIWAFDLNCAQGADFLAISAGAVSVIYIGQYFLMILLLFYRLKTVFDGTSYQLSQCTVWTFYSMYALFIILGVIVSSSNDVSGERPLTAVETTLTMLAGLLLLAIISLLTFLFVKKLIVVNKAISDASQNETNKLLSQITKQSILSLISISSFIVVLAIIGFLAVAGFSTTSVHGIFIWIFFSLIDVWTNFICIFLSYRSFGDYYTKMCGCCDTRCKRLCRELNNTEKNGTIAHENVESMSGPSVETTTSV